MSREHRREQTRDEQREQHRGGGRPTKLAEELARDTGHEGHRNEHRRERDGGGDHGDTDFIGSIDGRLHRWLAHGAMPRHVLDFDDSIVDEYADHHRQREQGE